MDTSELLAQLQRRTEETRRDRDRLAEAVAALNSEIAHVEADTETLSRLISRFAIEDGESEGPDSSTVASSDYNVNWPAGPGFSKPLKTKKAKTWARYKFSSADWYLNTLRDLFVDDGKLQRVLGVEMAVDGVIQALTATFDAAIYALTNTVERAAKISKDRRTPVHLASWSKLTAEAQYFGFDLASSLSVSHALIGEHSEDPEGWLAQLLVLRRRATCQDLLVSQQDEKTGIAHLAIEVPGRGPLPLLSYLVETRDLVEELLETILHDIKDAKNGRLNIAGIDQLRLRAERGMEDLLPTAGEGLAGPL
jgi:hypothetical protein